MHCAVSTFCMTSSAVFSPLSHLVQVVSCSQMAFFFFRRKYRVRHLSAQCFHKRLGVTLLWNRIFTVCLHAMHNHREKERHSLIWWDSQMAWLHLEKPKNFGWSMNINWRFIDHAHRHMQSFYATVCMGTIWVTCAGESSQWIYGYNQLMTVQQLEVVFNKCHFKCLFYLLFS